MDHSPADYANEGNTVGVGPSFGVTQKTGTDKEDKLDVSWYDGQSMKVKQVLAWVCPAAGTRLRVKDPFRKSGQLLLEVKGYSKRGVQLVVQSLTKEAVSPNKRKRNPGTKKTTTRKPSPQTGGKKQRKRSARQAKIRKRLELANLLESSNDSDASEYAKADARWARFRRKQLDAAANKKIVEQVVLREQDLVDEVFDKEDWICFIDRVAREYLYLHDRNYPLDAMHLYRESAMAGAVSVIMTQLVPKTVKPMDGNMEEIVPATQRIVEYALELKGKPKPEKENSSGWVAAKLKSGEVLTFRECDEHPELMDAKVARTMATWYKKGSRTGGYMLSPDQTIPGPEELYKLSDRRVGRRRATVGGVVVSA